MRSGGLAAIGFRLGQDLATILNRPGELRSRVTEVCPTRDTDYIIETLRRFVLSVIKGDVAIAVDGTRVLGIGQITGADEYDDR